MKLSGGDLLASPENNDGAVTYARILTRQRQTPEALKTLEAALHAAAISPSSPGLLMQQVEKQGIASVSDDEWRRNRVAQRKEQAATGFRNAVQQMSSAVSTYYTPEEKLSYAQLLDASVAHAPQGDVLSIWIPAALTAGLRDREAEWRLHALLNEHKFRQEQLDAFNLLEKQRMENAGRGQALENYADLWPAHRSDALALAEDAWRDEANHAKELAVLARMGVQGSTEQGAPQSNLRDRYLQLLLQSDPNKVVEEASASPEEYADFAANYVFTHGSPSLTYAAIDARAKSLSPVWHDANTALAGLYFADKSPGIDGVFRSALDDRNIGDRIKSSGLDSSHHLSGNGWFYYGMRYGVYRSVVASGGVEEYIASGLEGDPVPRIVMLLWPRRMPTAGILLRLLANMTMPWSSRRTRLRCTVTLPCCCGQQGRRMRLLINGGRHWHSCVSWSTRALCRRASGATLPQSPGMFVRIR